MRILALVYLFHFLRHGIIFPIIPLYAQELGAGPSWIGIIVGSFSLLSLILAIPIGGLIDKLDKKLVLFLGVACNIVYSLLLLFSYALPVLIAAQLIGGLGFLLLIVSSQTYVSLFAETRSIEHGFSLLAFVAAIGQAVGPFLGGVVLSAWNFKVVFGLALVLALSGLSISVLRAEGSNAQSKVTTLKKSSQMRKFLSDTDVSCVLLFTFSVVFAVNLRGSFMPVLLKHKGFSEHYIGLLISVLACSMTIIRFFMSRMLSSFSRMALLGSALFFVCLGASLLPLFNTAVMLGAILAVYGLGFGISQPLSMVMISDLTPGRHAGLAMGLRFTTITLATFLSPVLLGWVVAQLGLDMAFYAASALIVLTAIYIAVIKLRR